ncbi:MAG: FAD-dependent oxidoreductase [Alphaproteobacteria bacterium]|nr:MAG: FAD-dependent oxidoreductase [Alphaproteobacteria bacterium]
MKIAIIGSGISGLGAAYLLNERHDITIFEKEKRIGGHSNTVEVDYGDRTIPVDTGFIVYNELNYPNLTALFEYLNVPTQASNMSFAFSQSETHVEWCGDNLDTIFAFRRNVLSPSFILMLSNILKFNRVAIPDLQAGYLENRTLGDYLSWRGFGDDFRDRYLVPMGAAIWSTSPSEMLAFPAASFVRFFANHKLINRKIERPEWRTVSGGSREYVQRMTAGFQDKFRLGTKPQKVLRSEDKVTLVHEDGAREDFDEVIFACHSDEALALIDKPSAAEQALLGAIRYTPNTAILHADPQFMPQRRKAWASWNYMSAPTAGNDRAASITYWMNRLQGIDPQYPLFVSLNPHVDPDPDLTFQRFVYMHPLFDGAALSAQQNLQDLQGQNRSWFCGAYFGYGFHEDGLRSGLEVGERLGGQRPWAETGSGYASPARLVAAE